MWQLQSRHWRNAGITGNTQSGSTILGESMSRILITGSLGTLGRVLHRELESRGHEVWGCDLFHDRHARNIRADVSEYRQLSSVFQKVKPEVCYGLAAEFGRRNGQEFAEQLWRNNCIGTHNVIEMCKRYECRLIFASSSEAYGGLAASEKELKENILDYEVPAFFNEYSLSKWTNERQIQIAQLRHGLKATILRFFNVFGPGEYYSDYRSVVCLFIYRALKGLPITVYSETRRSFLYIDDWVRAVANVLDVPDDTFNIASTRSVTMAELWSMIRVIIGGDMFPVTWSKTESYNVRDKIANVDKAARLLGLTDSVSLEEGIKRTVEWMRKTYDI